jgi:hypothetical protein
MDFAGTIFPLEARIVAVADSFDAMTSERPYRDPRAARRSAARAPAGRGQPARSGCGRSLQRGIPRSGITAHQSLAPDYSTPRRLSW